ncbi:MAG: T9SS type A sorting domain-containing protein [Bacteroidota bacterium]
MKKNIFLCLLIFASSFAFAQQTLTREYMPNVDDTIFYRSISNSTVDFSPTGADFMWDFRNLNGHTWAADTFVAVLSTPLTYNAVFNNQFLYPAHKATIASPQADITIPPSTSMKDVYYYFKETDTAFAQVGLAANVSGAPLPVRFDNIDFMYKFPSTMGDVDSCFSSYQIQIPTLGFYCKKQNRVNEYDGWGTLYTPMDTFEVLRIKTTIIARDSIFITQYNVPFAFNTTTIEYKWFSPGYRNPIMYATETQGQGSPRKSVKYLDIPGLYTSIKPKENSTRISVTPNPFQNSIKITNSNNISAESIRLFSITGTRIAIQIESIDGQSINISTENIAKGCYIIEFKDSIRVERKVLVKD